MYDLTTYTVWGKGYHSIVDSLVHKKLLLRLQQMTRDERTRKRRKRMKKRLKREFKRQQEVLRMTGQLQVRERN